MHCFQCSAVHIMHTSHAYSAGCLQAHSSSADDFGTDMNSHVSFKKQTEVLTFMSLSLSCRCVTACRTSRSSKPTLSCFNSAPSLVFNTARATLNRTLGPSFKRASHTRAAVCNKQCPMTPDLPFNKSCLPPNGTQQGLTRPIFYTVFRIALCD